MSSPPRNGDTTPEEPAPAGEGDSVNPGEGDSIHPGGGDSGTIPGGDHGTDIQETEVKSFGLVIRSMVLDGHIRHFAAVLSLRLVEDKLTLHVGDELLMLNWSRLVDLPHEQVVELFRGLRTYMILLFRRRIIEGDFKFHYTAVEATLDIKEMDELVEHIDVKEMEHKMADDTSIIRWSQSDLIGYIIKSLGDPTKAMFCDTATILVGTLQNSPEYHMDLLMYIVYTPDSTSFAVLICHSTVYLEVTSSECVVSTTVPVDLDNPPQDMLFYYTTSESRLAQFTAFNYNAEYLATDGTSSLTLNNNCSDPNSTFEVLEPSSSEEMAASEGQTSRSENQAKMAEEQPSRSDSKGVNVSENSDHGQGTLFGCIPCLKLKSSRDNQT